MSVFGESTVFIVLAVGVFAFALVAEILSVRYQQTKCKFTQEVIDYLKDDSRRNSGQAVVFKREEVEKKLGKLGWDWLKKHLVGSLDSTGTYKTQPQDDRFVLLEYPHVLARAVPHSSLSFIPTLLTAIGLLGTFFGISTGLSKFDLSALDKSDKLLAASVHDHVFCWQGSCERWLTLRENGIQPNESTQYFKGLPKTFGIYNLKTGLPKPSFDDQQKRENKLMYWKRIIANLEREAREYRDN